MSGLANRQSAARQSATSFERPADSRMAELNKILAKERELKRIRAEQREAALLVIAGNTARGGPEDWLLDNFAEDVLMEVE